MSDELSSWWHRFLHDPRLFSFQKEVTAEGISSVFLSGFAGLEYMAKNRITKRWPNRLIFSRGDNPGVRKFNRYVGWVDNTPQRWLEWQLEEEPDEEDFLTWDFVCMTVPLSQMRLVMQKTCDRLEAQGQGQAQAAAAADTTADGGADPGRSLDWLDEEVGGSAVGGDGSEKGEKGERGRGQNGKQGGKKKKEKKKKKK
ncbi:hypothetical protein E4U41_002605 [Claviceps citrina]|nr:hypothetical protein E4U41_002605 [Claviceps citrina]